MKKVKDFKTGVSSSKISAILNKSKYRSVVDQYLYDTKQKKDSFTESARQKMSIGTLMEPLIMGLVQEYFDVDLTVDKNRYCHDDYKYMTIEFDALDYDNEVVYEFKNTEMDEDHLYNTYYPQVQFAMFMIGWKKARICYLRNGWELGYLDVKRDENFIQHMVNAAILYYQHMSNLEEPNPEDFDKISDKIDFYKERELKNTKTPVNLTEEEIQELHKWADIKKEINKLKIEEERIKGKFSDKFGKYEDDYVNFQSGEYIRKGSLDIAALKHDYKNIDFDKYQKPENKYVRQTLRFKQQKEDEIQIKTGREEDIV